MTATRTLAVCATAALLALAGGRAADAQTPASMLGLGDSIGEGVQSADAGKRTQPYSYLNLIARQAGIPFALPLIEGGAFSVIGDTSSRSRQDPSVASRNLAVSGHDVADLLRNQANASSEAEIDSETDLVLFPRLGSPIEIAEAVGGELIVCWIGNNDVLSSVLSFDALNGTQLTPVADFAADFAETAQRLGALGGNVIFADIPDVTDIAFLLDRNDLITFLGSDYGLPQGSYTSIVAMILIQLGLADASLLQNPDYVLDAAEIAAIRARTDQFNQIIRDEAAAIGAPVVDINAIFKYLHDNPPVIAGVPVTTRFLGGIFSLDAVHPSNFGHAAVANAFIDKINASFGYAIPRLSGTTIGWIFLLDPFIDKDGDLVVSGRPFAGLLETLGPFLGLSGDANDFDPGVQAGDATGAGLTRESVIAGFKRIYGRIAGGR